MTTTDDSFYYMRVEVTIAGAIIDPESRIAGNNVVDTTFAFGWRCDSPDGRTDAEINGALSHQISPVIALIRTALLTNGWIDMGQTDDPMTNHSHQVGSGLSSPVRVLLSDGKEGRA